MEETYQVPAQSSRSEFTERKSRFITSLCRVKTRQAAEDFIKKMRAQYPDATHHCTAYRIKDPLIERFSDDGEPGGTAGMPMLDILKKENLFDVIVVVTRYFGGILLGAGGLTRAYARAAAEGVRSAGTALMERAVRLEVQFGYGFYDRMQRLLEGAVCQAEHTEFGEEITLQLIIPKRDTAAWMQKIADISAGAARLTVGEELWYPFKTIDSICS